MIRFVSPNHDFAQRMEWRAPGSLDSHSPSGAFESPTQSSIDRHLEGL